MACLQSEVLVLPSWETPELTPGFSSWNTTSLEGEHQAILWQDLRQVEVSDACELSSYDEPARLAWLETVFNNLQGNPKIQIERQIRARMAMDSLTNAYSAFQRALLTMPTARSRVDGCDVAVL